MFNECLYGCVRLGNLDLDFENPDCGFAIEREIRKRISTLRYMFLDFLFTVRLGNPKKYLKNCPQEQRSCTRTRD